MASLQLLLAVVYLPLAPLGHPVLWPKGGFSTLAAVSLEVEPRRESTEVRCGVLLHMSTCGILTGGPDSHIVEICDLGKPGKVHGIVSRLTVRGHEGESVRQDSESGIGTRPQSKS